jgi:hypothetical protein
MWWKSEGGISGNYQEQAVEPSLVSTQVAPLQTQSVYKLVRAILPSIPDEQVTGWMEFFVSLRDVRSAVPALKFPEASLFTIVLAVLASVAALAALAPEAMFAADTSPTVLTTVAP